MRYLCFHIVYQALSLEYMRIWTTLLNLQCENQKADSYKYIDAKQGRVGSVIFLILGYLLQLTYFRKSFSSSLFFKTIH